MKFRFIQIPRTGTNSITTALGIGHNHFTYLKATEKEEFDLTFAVVRNTYDRLVSWYVFHNGNHRDQFQNWVKNGCKVSPKWGRDWLVEDQENNPLNQLVFIEDKDGKIGVDYVIRFENLSDFPDFAESRLDIKIDKMPNKYSFDYKYTKPEYNPGDFYNQETIDKVTELFKEEIELFDFKYGL